MKTKYSLPALLFFTLCLMAAAAYAVATQVRITKMTNVALGTWAFSSMTGNDDVCVYTNGGADTSYHVTGTDNSTIMPAILALENAAFTWQIPYAAFWNNTVGPGGTTAMPDGVLIAATGANTASQPCGGGSDANYRIDVNNSDLAAVPAGTYSATLTLVVRP